METNAAINDTETRRWFEAIWADREDHWYRAFFGPPTGKVYAIPARVFHAVGQPNPDPRFLTHTVLEYPPTATRPSWIYVTSGMSNPWGESPLTVEPENFSGLGLEFVVHTREQAHWPIHLLHQIMAIQLMVATGDAQGQLLERHDRVPLGVPLVERTGHITWLLAASPAVASAEPLYPERFSLASGKVDLLLMLGITEREAEFAKTQGADALITVLRHHDIFPLTDPTRPSAI